MRRVRITIVGHYEIDESDLSGYEDCSTIEQAVAYDQKNVAGMEFSPEELIDFELPHSVTLELLP